MYVYVTDLREGEGLMQDFSSGGGRGMFGVPAIIVMAHPFLQRPHLVKHKRWKDQKRPLKKSKSYYMLITWLVQGGVSVSRNPMPSCHTKLPIV